MDEWSADVRGEVPNKLRRCSLAIAGARYPIVSEDAASCLIQAEPGARMRGYADIYEGERHRAHCLVVLSQAEGGFLRVVYKYRTESRNDPPAADYASPEPAAG